MGRVFDMLKIVSHDTARSIETEEQAADPRLMVALYTTEVYRTLLSAADPGSENMCALARYRRP